MSGRGAYYKEKYGGGRGGRGYGRGEGYGGRGEGGRGGRGFGRGRGRGHHGYGGHHGHGGVKEAPTFFDNLPSGAVQDESGEFTFENEDKRARHTASSDRLENLLADLDNAPYGLYKRLYDSNYQFRSPFPFVLQFSHIQGDPYAAASRLAVRIPLESLGYPSDLFGNDIRSVALCDYLTRSFVRTCKEEGVDIAKKGSWKGAKGGDLKMEGTSQHVMPRTSIQILRANSNLRTLEIRFQMGLPARGRSILGEWCRQLLFDTLPTLIQTSLMWSSLPESGVYEHINTVEDQEQLRSLLSDAGLIAFVRDGSILPRRSGASDLPMDTASAVPFVSPENLRVNFELKHVGVVSGLGIKKGVTLITGGGFHGKSSLLGALQMGIYNHIPGDGREFVCCDVSAVKIRAEDGRAVTSLDISPFINNLPGGKTTDDFETTCASGSTSQSANICEMLEMGTQLLLLDEDTCATNFMYRDQLMASLVESKKEPITPFLQHVKDLWVDEDSKVSTIIVVGGCGGYFSVADTVLMMDNYVCKDATTEAANIFASAGISTYALKEMDGNTGNAFARNLASTRAIDCSSLKLLDPSGRFSVRTKERIGLGREEHDLEGNSNYLDLYGLEQITEVGQTRALSEILQYLSTSGRKHAPLRSLLEELYEAAAQEGVDGLIGGGNRALADLAMPRIQELAMCINRWRYLKVSY